MEQNQRKPTTEESVYPSNHLFHCCQTFIKMLLSKEKSHAFLGFNTQILCLKVTG